MEWTRELTAVGAVLLPLLGFFAHWGWARFWQKSDGKKAGLEATVTMNSDSIVEIVRRVDAVEYREGERQRQIGAMESKLGNLDGKIDGLQTFWRTEFAKLEEKIDKRLEALESRLTTALADHRRTMHDRLNIIASEQAKMLNELIDKLVDRQEQAPKEKD